MGCDSSKEEGKPQDRDIQDHTQSKTHDEEHAAKHPFVQQLWQVPGNKFCADCAAPNPTWASRSLGTLICKACSGIHRRLGVHISFVQSLVIDDWPEKYKTFMLEHGNEKSNAEYEFLKDAASKCKPKDDDVHETDLDKMKKHAAFCHSKYTLRNFTEGGSGECVQWDDGVSTSDSTVGLIENMGVLMLINMSAKDLPALDMPPFLSDPYVILTLGDQNTRTTTIEQDLNPKWNDMINLNVQRMDQTMRIEIWDEDFGRPDDPIGQMAFTLNEHFTDSVLAGVTSGGSVTVEVEMAVTNPGPGTLTFTMVYTSLQ